MLLPCAAESRFGSEPSLSESGGWWVAVEKVDDYVPVVIGFAQS